MVMLQNVIIRRYMLKNLGAKCGDAYNFSIA